MSNIVEIFCLDCKKVFKYKKKGTNLHQYNHDNSIYDKGNKIKCTCGCARLKFDGYLNKSDVLT